MLNVADASLNTFGPSPEVGFELPSDDPILEMPLSELEGLIKDVACLYNQIAEIARDSGILRGRELARLTESHNQALRAEKSPVTKILLLNAYIRQFLARVREALKARPQAAEKVVQVCSKIMARAIKIVDHIKAVARDEPSRKEISLDSSHARALFSGADGEQVSRKETIRAMKRAERLWPALLCSHRPGDARQTMRITTRAEDAAFAPEIDHSYAWQRCEKSIGLSL